MSAYSASHPPQGSVPTLLCLFLIAKKGIYNMSGAPAPASGAPARGSFGRGRGRGRGAPRKANPEEAAWVPVTKLGRLVHDGKITSLDQIFLFSLPIKEYQIVDAFFKASPLKDEVMKIMPVQKQTRAGQRTRFKAFVVVGDSKGHVGLGWKCAKEVATAIRGAMISAKLAISPVRMGYWGTKLGAPHTVPAKVSSKAGSVMCRLIPAPRGAGLVAAGTSKKVLQLAGIEDCYTCSTGKTRTLGNFVKATFGAIQKTYSFLTPDLWVDQPLIKAPNQQFSDYLAQKHNKDKKY
ncbi:30S ribosomal protein S2e, variant [Fonticula alba]|uniref:Small ribosomal subunit protein uS5 n=1 Tax=Fonticula alba TaxID=691883 RepID=A0A058Z1Q8_FONAL|nr:30S ribosomal protein S2e, variant [Fonticula alba]KCV68219.1 30S ribosomal protein S2e, variant [Fonticula alba]|eukprot:XP_009497273.1 30S ribosomal protein S2e, variant [Fonticula alba]